MGKVLPGLAPTTKTNRLPDCQRSDEPIPGNTRLDNYRYGTKVVRQNFAGQCVRQIGTSNWVLRPFSRD